MSFNPLATQSPGWYLTVDSKGAGERLDCFIARRLPRLSRSRAAKLNVYYLDQDGFTKSVPLKKSTKLKVQQSLWVQRPLPKENLIDLPTPVIIDECEDFIVVDKPAGWVAHPTASRFHSAITTWLRSNHYHAQPVHRLDCETSGILICAKHHQAEIELQKAFINQQVCKKYLGICKVSTQGHTTLHSKGSTWLENEPLGFDLQSRVGIKMGSGEKKASTTFQVLSLSSISPLVNKTSQALNSPSQSYALIRATPNTGRQHQIRVHLSLLGLSLVGDKLYGIDENYFLKGLAGELTQADYQELGHIRHALHATSLSFMWHGQQRCWHSQLPQDMHRLLQSYQLEDP